MEKFRVIVGNIGTVYSGGIQRFAEEKYSEYVKRSKSGCGRAAGEGVVLLERDNIKREYVGNLGESDDRIDR